jgi:hypothetical protein
MSIVAATIINIEAFIAASRCGPQPSQFSAIQNECTVNASAGVKPLIAAHRRGRDLIGNSAQYQNDNEYSRKRQSNRFCNRALVSHGGNLDFQNDMNTQILVKILCVESNFWLPEQVRQLGDIRRNPPRLVPR